MQIFTRGELVERLGRPAGPALLCEGDWPPHWRGPQRASLDAMPAADWHELDELASDWSTALALPADGANGSPNPPLAYVNALRLRYALVKLLRVVAGLDQCLALLPPETAAAGRRLRLWAVVGRDADYAALIEAYGAARGYRVDVSWLDGRKAPPAAHAPNGFLRRWAAALVQAGLGRAPRTNQPPSPGGPRPLRVVLRGNPRRMECLARQLLARGAQVAWLQDRLGWRWALKWLGQGVYPIVAEQGPTGDRPRLADYQASAPFGATPKLTWRGVPFGPAVEAWLSALGAAEQYRQAAQYQTVRSALALWRPDWLLLDEDATPGARIAVDSARRFGIATGVVQHGAPVVRFGFAPLEADTFFAWGPSTREQLLAWGVPSERVELVGSPWHETWLNGETRSAARAANTAPMRGPRVLVLGTVPPRDERPDAISLPLTSGRYRQLLDDVLEIVARWPGAELWFRPHPRCGDDRLARQAMAGQASVRARRAPHGRLEQHLAWADVVLACASSSGVDAALAGRPTIQLLPPGSANLLPPTQWGFLGTAHSRAELLSLLEDVLGPSGSAGRADWGNPATRSARADRPLPTVLTRWPQGAAARIVDLLEARRLDGAGQLPSRPEQVPGPTTERVAA